MTDKPQPTKAAFAWASIAGAEAEPVEVIERDGRKGVLTIGCPDPFWLDDKAAGVRLDWDRMERPNSIQTERQRALAAARYRRDLAHSWRGSR